MQLPCTAGRRCSAARPQSPHRLQTAGSARCATQDVVLGVSHVLRDAVQVLPLPAYTSDPGNSHPHDPLGHKASCAAACQCAVQSRLGRSEVRSMGPQQHQCPRPCGPGRHLTKHAVLRPASVLCSRALTIVVANPAGNRSSGVLGPGRLGQDLIVQVGPVHAAAEELATVDAQDLTQVLAHLPRATKG